LYSPSFPPISSNWVGGFMKCLHFRKEKNSNILQVGELTSNSIMGSFVVSVGS
jgi:hypothetical protein